MIAVRNTALRSKLPAGILLGCVIAVSALGTSPARAQDEEGSIMKGVIDFVIGRKTEKEPIDYQERSPLVVPPSHSLPPPEKAGDIAASNPAWPKDADVRRRKIEADWQRNRDIHAEIERESRPLPPNEVGPRGVSRGEATPINSENDTQLTPSQLGYRGGMFDNVFTRNFFRGIKKDETAQFTGEKPRTTLIQPPAGYQTPSPNQPYGTTKSRTDKPEDNYTTRSEASPHR